jgi:hypothetical protein
MCQRCKDQVSDAFVRGIATIFWGNAWADHVEEHRCASLSGIEITSVMPEIPEVVWRMAERFAGMVEQANDLTLPALFAQAMKYTGRELTHKDYWSDTAERFGECLAWEAMGAGVSWYDDHPEFKIELPLEESREMIVPDIGTCELRNYADEHCETAEDASNDAASATDGSGEEVIQ